MVSLALAGGFFLAGCQFDPAKEITYTVSFDLNFDPGKDVDIVKPDNIVVKEGESIVLPDQGEEMTKPEEKPILAGWKIGARTCKPKDDYKVTRDVTCRAQWTAEKPDEDADNTDED